MDAARRRRPQNHQPRLPLGSSGDGRERARDEEWRLDEETRQIGLRGVALAKARLRGAGDPEADDRVATVGAPRVGERAERPNRANRSAGRAA